jgi:MscS family membrane protein
MIRHLIVLFFSLFLTGTASADQPWAGQWQLTWRDGGSMLTLLQNGTSVTGSYGNGRGRVEGTADGNRFEGDHSYDGVNDRFIAVLSADGASFSGRAATGDWLNGVRLVMGQSAGGTTVAADLSSPRATIKSFMSAGNLGLEGVSHSLAWVIDAIDFGTDTGWLTREAQFTGAKQLFDLMNLSTFSLATIPDAVAGTELKLSLPRLDSKPPIEIDMVRSGDNNWRIRMPSPDALRTALLSGDAQPADAFRQMQSPRDTLHAFLNGMAQWNNGGEADAISTIDLSQVPEVLRYREGSIIAQYLVRLIDRVGNNILQAVPNSGSNREAFVFFENPSGRVVIEPIGTGADTRWKFSAETVRDVRALYRAVEQLPDARALDSILIPPSPMFAIRNTVKSYAPILLNPLRPHGRVEYWQLGGALLLLAVMVVSSYLLRRIFFWLLSRPAIMDHVRNPRRLATALGVGTAFGIGAPLVFQLGLPASARQFTLPVIGTLLLLIVTYAAWQLILALYSISEKLAHKTETPIDNILLTFVAGVAKVATLVAAGLALSQLWSVPTTGLLAGLGISGLALAFASKETLANVFGAGILLGDRPFRKGDRIIAGDVNGWVEAVGLRSTRIRTLHDSLLVVPNGKLADTTINNLGARRRRTLTSTVLVTSGSTPEKLQAFTQAISGRISADPLFDPGTEVNIIGITAVGIQIEISTSLNTRRGVESRAATHRLFLDILHMAEAEGLTLGRGMERSPVYVLQET